MKKILNFTVLVSLTFVLSSCDSVLSFFGAYMCGLVPDSDHCYQWQAVQSGDPADCAKIKGTKFAKGGSNPPRDKCYLQIAENTGNYDVCKKIQGGLMSYTQTECIYGAAVKHDDPVGCQKLTKGSTEYANCISQVATTEKVKSKDAELANLREELGDDPGNRELRKKYEALKNDLNTRYALLNPTERMNLFKEKREEIMKDIDDEDVKLSIASSFNRNKGGDAYTDQVSQLQDITEKQQLIKELDDSANTLTDTIKETMGDFVNDQKDEYLDGLKEKGEEWLDENLSKDMKYKLGKLEKMKEKFDKGSEAYDDVMKKYESFKKAYDEMQAIHAKVKEFDKMLGEGRINAGQARVLKGAVLLDKGLEYATGYVPVFGSTISTMSKATFETVIKLATKRAERTNSLQNCIDDPEHCDPSGISAY